MKDTTFTIDRDQLFNAVASVASALPDRTPLASYENIEFSLDKNILRLSGTDSNLYIRAKLAIKNVSKHTFLLNGKLLYRLLSNMDKGDVTFTVGAKQVSIVSGGSKNTLRLAEGDVINPFKDVDVTSEATIDAGVLSEALKTVLVSINTKQIGTVIDNCVWYITPKTLTLVGSNQRIISTVTEQVSQSTADTMTLLSRKYSYYVSKMFTSGNVAIRISKGIIGFDNGTLTLCCRVEEGEYPEVSKFVPKEYSGSFVIGRELLIKAISRAISISNPANEWIDFRLDATKDKLHIYSEDAEILSESHEDLEVSYDGPELSHWFNAKYILPLLQSVSSEEVAVLFPAKGTWITIKPIGMDNVMMYIGLKRKQ